MRLTARFAAPLLALVAFAAPATVPAAHAAQFPMVHTPTGAFAPNIAEASPGDVFTIGNTSTSRVIYAFWDATTGAQVGTSSTPNTTVPGVRAENLTVPQVAPLTRLNISATSPGSAPLPGLTYAQVVVV